MKLNAVQQIYVFSRLLLESGNMFLQVGALVGCQGDAGGLCVCVKY